MKFEELKGKKIRWDLTPQTAMLDEILNSSGDMDLVKTKSMEENECFFYITVWN